MSRWAKRVVVAIPVLGLLAYASYDTTRGDRDGGFPSGEFRIDVRDPEGKPVPGAVLRCTRRRSGEPVSGYPLDGRAPGEEMIADDTGRIVAIQPKGGIQFGGEVWWLFWVIPMGAQEGPEYDCEITAAGFKPLKFPLERLFATRFRGWNEFPKTKILRNGSEIELPIYEHTFNLVR